MRPVGRRSGWLRDRILDEEELADRRIHGLQALGRDDPLWPGQLATFAALLLYLALPAALTLGPGWPLPVAGAAALAALLLAARSGREVKRRREAAIGLPLLAALANLLALGFLAHYLLSGGPRTAPISSRAAC